jgi:uncharacterized protein
MGTHLRRCLVCRRVAPREQFWRVVRCHPGHNISLDTGMGRSAYLCPTHNCLQGAQRKNRLSRVLKAPVPEAIFLALWDRLDPSITAD